MTEKELDIIYQKLKQPMMIEFNRAQRYNIPLTIAIMQIEQKSFLENLRRSDVVINLIDNIYLLSSLFCNYENAILMIKRIKREYSFLFNKEIEIFYITYENSYPLFNKELIKQYLNAFKELNEKKH